MYTINEIKEKFNRAFDQYNSLLSIYKDEVKEFGNPKEDTIILFNALFLQLQESVKCIENGLNGIFPFEKEV
jgi:hypothetical protein